MFSAWSKPPGKTEQERCDRAVRAIKDAVAVDPTLATKTVRTFPQGSYRNRTNVRQDSDVDLCVLCEDTFYYDLPAGVSAQDAGIMPATYKFGNYKNDVERALVNRFGRSNVRRGNKAFDVNESRPHPAVSTLTPPLALSIGDTSPVGRAACNIMKAPR